MWQHAWITGASRGIGRAVALRLAAGGTRVAASARPSAALDSLVAAGCGRIAAFPLDVTDPGAAADTFARIEAAGGPLDLAILNAGTHGTMPADAFDAVLARHIVDVNLTGLINGLGAVLPPFLARRGGHIALMGSVAGYRGLPAAAVYSATKAGIIALAEGLRPDVERAGVKLQLVSPGFVDTPLTRENDFPMPFLIQADDAAERIVRGLGSRRFEVVFPLRMKLAMKILRVLPYPLFFMATRRMLRIRKDV